jgi:hypothetical protein
MTSAKRSCRPPILGLHPAAQPSDRYQRPAPAAGLVAIAYQETSRGGELGADPHLHSHVIPPNWQLRADGILVSIDSKSLYHEAKAAGVIYQAVLRHELHVEPGWIPRTGSHSTTSCTTSRRCFTTSGLTEAFDSHGLAFEQAGGEREHRGRPPGRCRRRASGISDGFDVRFLRRILGG